MPVQTDQKDCFSIAERPAPASGAAPFRSGSYSSSCDPELSGSELPESSQRTACPAHGSHSAPNAHSAHQPHIIVVDDDVLIALALRVVLQGYGYRVSLAYDGLAALDIDDADPADAVLTDVNMPKMNGISLTLALHHKRPDLPIIILSSSAHEPVISPVRQQLFAVLSKPAVAVDIRATLQRAINQHAEYPAAVSLCPTMSR